MELASSPSQIPFPDPAVSKQVCVPGFRRKECFRQISRYPVYSSNQHAYRAVRQSPTLQGQHQAPRGRRQRGEEKRLVFFVWKIPSCLLVFFWGGGGGPPPPLRPSIVAYSE